MFKKKLTNPVILIALCGRWVAQYSQKTNLELLDLQASD
jgi:hypothetical protein